jgi:hypothetical protein
LNSDPLNLVLTRKTDVHPHPPALFFPLSHPFGSGVNEYWEDLVSQIDSPLFHSSTTFFGDINYNIPEPNQFISRANIGAIRYSEARLIFHRREALVRRYHLQSGQSGHGTVEVKILCHSVRSATFIPGANPDLVVTSLFNNGEPLHLRGSIFTTHLGGWYGEYRMVRFFTAVNGSKRSNR